MSTLVCPGRHTVTGLLCTSGQQAEDWTAAYRLFSRERVSLERIFDVLRAGVIEFVAQDDPLVVALDDTLLHKTGRKVPGAAYRRDPLGPTFHKNFVWAQRALQISAAVPGGPGQARMLPIDFVHAPTARRPRKTAPAEAWQDYERARQELNLSRRAVERLSRLREKLDAAAGSQDRALWVVADSNFTNRKMLRGLPPRTVLIGRTRADARLHHLPQPEELASCGRHRVYGRRAPTPEQLRRDDDVPWETARVFAAGRYHDFKIKTLAPLRSRLVGSSRTLRMIVIAPLAYRPRKGAHLLYRKPAYLLCTDPHAPVDKILQAYVWRWGIEVNFRDEKQLIGVGEAQVRSPSSVEAVPALAVASYGMLLLAAARAFGAGGIPEFLPAPRWRCKSTKLRASTSDLLRLLRHELWGHALRQGHFSHFAKPRTAFAKPKKRDPQLASAVLYAVA